MSVAAKVVSVFGEIPPSPQKVWTLVDVTREELERAVNKKYYTRGYVEAVLNGVAEEEKRLSHEANPYNASLYAIYLLLQRVKSLEDSLKELEARYDRAVD